MEPNERLNGCHAGEDIFVIGAGPQLAELSTECVRSLERKITIGVNLSQYVIRPTYFLSAYLEHIVLAHHRATEATKIHMRPDFAPPLLEYILPLRREVFKRGRVLPSRLKAPEPTLLTRNNVVLAATHLAFIMGAARIVYVGVDQRSALHFFSLNKTIRDEILADIEILPPYHALATDHSYYTYDHLHTILSKSAQTLAREPFHSVSHQPTFAAYFAQLKKHGVEIISTQRKTVICDAGGKYVSLTQVLGDRGFQTSP